jgi:hypothetical protein
MWMDIAAVKEKSMIKSRNMQEKLSLPRIDIEI